LWDRSAVPSKISDETFDQKLTPQRPNRGHHIENPHRSQPSSNTSETTSPTTEATTKCLAEFTEPMILDSKDADASVSHESPFSDPVPELRPATDGQGRSVIYVDDVDFITMHNILYFFYTGHVNMHLEGATVRGRYKNAVDGYPGKVDPFTLLQAANIFLLEDLEERCRHFLISTCTPNNVCSRLFGVLQCKHYKSLMDGYIEYIIQHFDVVKMTPEWEQMLLNLRNCSPEMVEYQSRLLLEISKMTFGVK
jgi:BTB/POZ domain